MRVAAEKGGGMERLLVQQGQQVVTLPVVVPNRWSGERACLVGPFSSKETAKTFAEIYAISFVDLTDEPLVVRRDSWYVTVAA
jgi:hypothetical protein